jgi:hypothetical protein
MMTWVDGLAALGVGIACRAAVLFLARPSEDTRARQLKVTPFGTLVQVALGTGAAALLQFPATVLVPLASYLLVRLLLGHTRIQTVGLKKRDLYVAFVGGVVITLAAAIIVTWIRPIDTSTGI